jgi:hypothetical protein
MTSFPKVRTLWIMGLMLACFGALFHSHAESWATSMVTTTMSSSGTMPVVDHSLDQLFGDSGMMMMGLGAISFTLGIVGWLYPPRENPRSER